MSLAGLEERSERYPAPPMYLEMAWRCKRWDSLPLGGGVLDQPYLLMVLMDVAEQKWNELKGMDEVHTNALSRDNVQKLLKALPGGRK